MGRRRGGAVAVVFGALLGVAAAVARHADTPAPPAKSAVATPQPAAPTASVAPEPSATREPSALTEPSAVAPAPPLDTDVAAPNTAPSAAAVLASAAPAATGVPVITFPPLETPKDLERAEVRCYRKLADECERAATAYAQGRFGPADIDRAAHLREVSLTFLVKDCQRRSPHACLVLAGRYAQGIGVDPNPKKARAVFEHGRELCRRKPGPECAGGAPR